MSFLCFSVFMSQPKNWLLKSLNSFQELVFCYGGSGICGMDLDSVFMNQPIIIKIKIFLLPLSKEQCGH